MAFGPWGALAGGALGLYKGMLDQQREGKDRQIAATTARYSPWTGMKPQEVQRASMMGDVMQGGATGAALGQGLSNQQSQQKLVDAQTNYYNAKAGQPGDTAMATNTAGSVTDAGSPGPGYSASSGAAGGYAPMLSAPPYQAQSPWLQMLQRGGY